MGKQEQLKIAPDEMFTTVEAAIEIGVTVGRIRQKMRDYIRAGWMKKTKRGILVYDGDGTLAALKSGPRFWQYFRDWVAKERRYSQDKEAGIVTERGRPRNGTKATASLGANRCRTIR